MGQAQVIPIPLKGVLEEKVERIKTVKTPEKSIRPRVLLIDDDPLFCLKMKQIAKNYRFPLSTLDAVHDVDEVDFWNFDLVVLDFDLGNKNGIEVAEQLEDSIGDVPILLVSHSDRQKTENWPESIRRFLRKDAGGDVILEAALAVYLS